MKFNDFLLDLDYLLSKPDGKKILFTKLEKDPLLANKKDINGTTLLHEVSTLSIPSIVEKLCIMGAKTNEVSLLGETPLINVVLGYFSQIACEPVETATILLEFGAKPNLIAYHGCSALHQAVIHAQRDLVEILIKYGGDPKKCINDPPFHENAIEIVNSNRFLGCESERKLMLDLLKS